MSKILRRLLTLLFVAGLVVALGYGLSPKPVEVDWVLLERGAIRVTVDQDGKTRIRERYIVSVERLV